MLTARLQAKNHEYGLYGILGLERHLLSLMWD